MSDLFSEHRTFVSEMKKFAKLIFTRLFVYVAMYYAGWEVI